MSTPWIARPATPAHYEAFVRLVPELHVPDPIPERARWEAEMLSDMIFLDAGDPGAPVAYAWGKVFGEIGRVIHVVVDPAWRGRGVGGALMTAFADRLRAAGCHRWVLNVKVDNVPAIRLYESLGMRRAYRSTALWLPWEGVAALPRDEAAGPQITARAIEPADEAGLEAAFALLPGRLADSRARGRVLLQLVDLASSAEPRVGLASFDPVSTIAYPFAVARPSLAPALLDALRPHARPGDARLHLLIDRDDALVAAMCAVGASVAFEVFNMEGVLSPRA